MTNVSFFFIFRTCKIVDKRYEIKCQLEKTLSFEGIISNYKTDILAEKSTFYLNDTIFITVPRNSKELSLMDYDTIIKANGSNLYIVKRHILWKGQTKQKIDTFVFACPEP